MVSLIHVVVAFRLADIQTGGLIASFRRFFPVPDVRLLTDNLGLGNWAGLAAAVIAVGLLAISSDFALGKLKAGPWKRLQRLNYGLFVLVVAHAVFYGALLRVGSPTTVLLAVCVTAVFVGQMLGIWRFVVAAERS